MLEIGSAHRQEPTPVEVDMTSSTPVPCRGPALWLKILVSLVVLWHFAMILTTATSAGSQDFPPSLLTQKVFTEVAKPYLQPIFLTNPYRFYAPNPNNSNLMWCRLEYENGGVRWVDFADRDSFANRMQYQRYICMHFQLSNMVRLVPDPRYSALSPQAFICVQSYARHAARELPALTPAGAPNPVKEIDIYHVMHLIAEPVHYRMGWTVDDLRLHQPVTFFGTYDAKGNRIDISGEDREYQVNTRKVSGLAAFMVEEHRKLLKGLEGQQLKQRMADLQTPQAIRVLISDFPELLTSPLKGEDLVDKVRQLVEARDNVEAKKNALPIVHYPTDW
jgi:hypothetical protein